MDFHEEKMALVLHKTVLFNQVCKNALRQSSRFMCMKANPADTPDYNPNEHHHWAKPPSKENYYRTFFFNLFQYSLLFIFIETPRWMKNKTLKSIALFGDTAVINKLQAHRETRRMAEGNKKLN